MNVFKGSLLHFPQILQKKSCKTKRCSNLQMANGEVEFMVTYITHLANNNLLIYGNLAFTLYLIFQ